MTTTITNKYKEPICENTEPGNFVVVKSDQEYYKILHIKEVCWDYMVTNEGRVRYEKAIVIKTDGGFLVGCEINENHPLLRREKPYNQE